MLVVALTGEGIAVAADAFENRPGKGITVLARGDEATIHRMIHEPAFEKNAGYGDVADDDEAGALDAAVEKTHLAEHRGMERGGEGDIFGITGMAAVLLEIAVTEILLIHRGHATRREGESFDAGCAAARAFVEVDANENGAGKFVGDRSTILERNENIARAGEVDGIAILLEESLGAEDDIESSVFFEAAAAFCSAVMAAVAGIENDGADGRAFLIRLGRITGSMIFVTSIAEIRIFPFFSRMGKQRTYFTLLMKTSRVPASPRILRPLPDISKERPFFTGGWSW